MDTRHFSQRAQQVLGDARISALEMNHEYIGTEHVLLGLLRDEGGVAATVIDNIGIDRKKARQLIEETVRRGKPRADEASVLPFTSKAKLVLDRAVSEASDLGHRYVGAEHLLLALISTEKTIAAAVLADVGMHLAPARAETLRLLGTMEPPDRPTDSPS
jgi:ATP-dependent Clp protease ATP-binding subunit ClpC